MATLLSVLLVVTLLVPVAGAQGAQSASAQVTPTGEVADPDASHAPALDPADVPVLDVPGTDVSEESAPEATTPESPSADTPESGTPEGDAPEGDAPELDAAAPESTTSEAPSPDAPETLADAAAATSGQCGDSVTWNFDTTTGQLTISGTGGMYDYYDNRNQSSTAPWIGHGNSLTSVVVEDGVTRIGSGSFLGLKSLKNVTTPPSLQIIGNNAFREAGPLTNVQFSEGITKLETSVFAYSTVEHISLPNSIEMVEESIFYYAQNLKSVNLPQNLKMISSAMFKYCKNLESLTVPSNVTSIEAEALRECTGLKTMRIQSDKSLFVHNHVWSITYIDCNLDELIIDHPKVVTHWGWQNGAYFSPTSSVWRKWTDYFLGDNFGKIKLDSPSTFDGSTDGSSYESTEVGQKDGQLSSGTWLRRSAKWADAGKTVADIALDFSYSQRKGADFYFAVDASASVIDETTVDTGLASNLYAIHKAMLETADALYNTDGYDNRIGVLQIYGGDGWSTTRPGTNGNQPFGDNGFIDKAHASQLTDFLWDYNNFITFSSKSRYDFALMDMFDNIEGRSDKSRPLVIFFVSPGNPNKMPLAVERQKAALKKFKDAGYVIHGIAIGTNDIASIEDVADTVIVGDSTDAIGDAFTNIIKDALIETPAIVTDAISPYFELDQSTVAVVDEAGNPVSGAVEVRTDGLGNESFYVDFTKVNSNTKYKLTAQIKLKANPDGSYPKGELFTGDGYAVARMTDGTAINSVASPVLGRGVSRSLSVSMEVAGSDADRAASYPVEAVLTAADGTPYSNVSFTYTAPDGATVALPSDANGKVTFSLMHGQTGTLGGIPEDSLITVTEDPDTLSAQNALDGGAFADGASVSLTMSKNRSVAFKNSAAVPFSFTKVDAADLGVALAGAKFSLYRLNDPTMADPGRPGEGAHWGAPVEVTSDSAGLVDFGSLVPGVYGLVETSAPGGYSTPTGWWKVSLDASDKDSPVTIYAPDPDSVPAFVRFGSANALGLQNMRVMVPPFTGSGFGAFASIVGGAVALVCAALLATGRRKRAREQRS